MASGGGLRSGPTLEEIDNFFSLGEVKSKPLVPKKAGSTRPVFPAAQHLPVTRPPGPSYLQRTRANPHAYVTEFKKKHEQDVERMKSGFSNVRIDDAATLERLETHTMTSAMSSQIAGGHPDIDPLSSFPFINPSVVYRGYRPAVYDDKLPITRERQRILDWSEVHSCIIVSGMTGCGKTTQVPQYILDYYAAQGKYCKIAVTQPRRIAAISIARRVCQERGWGPGTYCGYQVARESMNDAEKTLITYMTTGILLQKLINDKHMNQYTHIILDEVHERDQDTDLALLIVRKFLRTVSSKTKVILMSATAECNKFAEYFGMQIRYQLESCPVIKIEGRVYEVEEIYWSDHRLQVLSDVVMPRFEEENPTAHREAMLLCVKLMLEFDRIEAEEQSEELRQMKPINRGSVLIFLPGIAEIQELLNLLENDMSLQEARLHLLPLHSTITLEEQNRVFQPVHHNYRKVILSTNIAESSITVPDIKYVIDFCLTKNLQTDRDTNMTYLALEWASQSNCIQRKGRAGRVSQGRCYRLIPRKFFKILNPWTDPEMTRCPLTQLVLRVKKLTEQDEEPRHLLSLALAPPDEHEIGKAVLRLKEAAALVDPDNITKFNPFDGEMTFIGEVLSSLPLSIELGKLLVFGYMLDCLDQCLIIAASMHTRQVFQQPFRRRVDAFKYKLIWDEGNHSDPIATVNAYRKWKQHKVDEYFLTAKNAEDNWCKKNFLQKRTLREVEDVILDLRNRLERHRITVNKTPTRRNDAEDLFILKIAIACAFYPNYFIQASAEEEDAVKELSGKSPMNTVMCRNLPNRQGILYKNQIERRFHEVIPGCQPKASFEDTRCYIEFCNTPRDTGRIPIAVYVALRMNQAGEKIHIQLYDDEQASMKISQIENRMREIAEESRTLNTARMHSGGDTALYSPISEEQRIDREATVLDLEVCHVEECGHFWAQLHDCNEKLAVLQQQINHNLHQCNVMSNPTVKSLCIATFEDQYYRARIDQIAAGRIKVFFIDYGNCAVIPAGQCRNLLPEFKNVTPFAIECYMTNIRPPNNTPKYSPNINSMFNQMVLMKRFYCKIYSTVQGAYRFDELESADNRTLLHDELSKKNMVSFQQEEITSQQNNKMRTRGLLSQAAYQGSLVPQQEWGIAITPDMDGHELRPTRRTQTLVGPTSPISLRFYALNTSGMRKQVKVEMSSVNTVALDEAPDDKHDKLMIAGSASITPNQEKIIARETTLMPNIHGLPALLCLLFSPTSQIRCDSLMQSYTGAICGLGTDPNTGGPAFPDHDIELQFDTEIDLDDIIRINGIRMSFNFCLSSTDMNHTIIAKFRNKIRENIIGLLSKDRKNRNKVSHPNSSQWTRVDTDQMLNTGINDASADSKHLFRLINPPLLETHQRESDGSVERKGLLEHCKRLWQISAYSGIDKPMDELCELCNVHLPTMRALQDHLHTMMHKRNEHTLYESQHNEF